MTRRSIPGGLDLKGDANLKTACELVCSALQEADPATVDLSLLLEAANLAAKLPVELGERREAVFKYVNELVEPQRSILLHRLAGRKARDIARMVRMDHRAVCNMLAVIYADMQALVSRQLQ